MRGNLGTLADYVATLTRPRVVANLAMQHTAGDSVARAQTLRAPASPTSWVPTLLHYGHAEGPTELETEVPEPVKPSPDSGYRLLALSGGGVRGVFQARFLEQLERKRNNPAKSLFSGVAATSTGSIVGLALAAGIPARNIVELYRSKAGNIFQKRSGSLLRTGGRYPQAPLRDALDHEFGDTRLGDLQMETYIMASTMDTYQGRVFSSVDEEDKHLRVVDVALASSAAPTFFPPMQVTGDQRAYVDGGLWANDPSMAVLRKLNSRGTSLSTLTMLLIGCGRAPRGVNYRDLVGLRTLSKETARIILDSVFALQEWNSLDELRAMLSGSQFLTINPLLPRSIPLDDVHAALDVLPGLADAEYAEHSETITQLLADAPLSANLDQMRSGLDRSVVIGAHEARLRTFIPSRGYYRALRDGRDSITAYISKAENSLVLVSINLMTGVHLEDILTMFRNMIERPGRPVNITVSLIDLKVQHVLMNTAPLFKLEWEDLATQIRETLEALLRLRESLSPALRRHLDIRCHSTLPGASAIMLDAEYEAGVIQLETKAYDRPPIEAYGFEVAFGSGLYDSLHKGYMKLLEDGRVIKGEDDL